MERELRATIANAERMGLNYIVYGARSNLGMAVARQGKLRDARAIEAMAVAFFEGQRDRRLAGASRMYLAIIELLDGDLDKAEADARAAVEVLDAARNAQAQALLARTLLARGALAEALEQSAAAYRQIGDNALFEGDATVRLVYAEALLAADQRAAANLVIATARARLLDRAARIGAADLGWRRSFLEEVPDHRRTVELAHKLSSG